MFPQFALNENELLAFALALLRVSAFVVSWPVFSVYSVPNQAKVLFALLLTALMFPVIARGGLDTARLGDEIVWLAAKEALLGVCLGFVARMFFFAVSVGGNLVSTYMGLASGQVYNPALGSQVTTVEHFYVTLATLVFLAVNGHHMFIDGLARSFELVPLSTEGLSVVAFRDAVSLLKDVLVVGIQISAPVMVVIFVLNVFMGILGRAVPQINVLVTSLSVNIMAGIVVMIISVPALVPESELMLGKMTEQLFKMLKAF